MKKKNKTNKGVIEFRHIDSIHEVYVVHPADKPGSWAMIGPTTEDGNMFGCRENTIRTAENLRQIADFIDGLNKVEKIVQAKREAKTDDGARVR